MPKTWIIYVSAFMLIGNLTLQLETFLYFVNFLSGKLFVKLVKKNDALHCLGWCTTFSGIKIWRFLRSFQFKGALFLRWFLHFYEKCLCLISPDAFWGRNKNIPYKNTSHICAMWMYVWTIRIRINCPFSI